MLPSPLGEGLGMRLSRALTKSVSKGENNLILNPSPKGEGL